MKKSNEKISYIIPPNFIERGTFFGGMFKARNAIEAIILAIIIVIPILNLDISLTTRIITVCLTALPVALFALIGVAGESLSSFAWTFIKFLHSRRIIEANISSEKITKKAKKK